MVYSVAELMVVLTNLTCVVHRGKPCTCPGVALSVAVWELPIWLPSVRWLEGSSWCLVVPGSHNTGDGVAVPGMTAQRRGWRHKAEGDRGVALHWPDVTVLSCAARGVSVRTSFEGSTVLSRGVRRGGRAGVGDTMSGSWHWPYHTAPVQCQGWLHREGWRNSVMI
jgi:hypothetical protein